MLSTIRRGIMRVMIPNNAKTLFGKNEIPYLQDRLLFVHLIVGVNSATGVISLCKLNYLMNIFLSKKPLLPQKSYVGVDILCF